MVFPNNLDFPVCLEEIGDCSFAGAKITNLDIPDTVKKIGFGAFSYCSNLTVIKLPAALEELGESAFESCQNFSQINALPDGLVEIGSQALKNTGLSTIEIPSTVKHIGSNAFGDCRNLKSIVVHDEGLERKLQRECKASITITYI